MIQTLFVGIFSYTDDTILYISILMIDSERGDGDETESL